MPPLVTRFAYVVLSAALMVLVLAAGPATAGPPLLCHPFDIGSARSLPWDGSTSWAQGKAGYDVGNLVGDTVALLGPDTPVLVRMETLRRAAIYASLDAEVAKTLLSRLRERALTADRAGRANALALLDAAYLTEALRQVTMLDRMDGFRDRARAMRALVIEADGPALIQRSLAAQPHDPALEFAAALIVADKDRSAYERHAAKARQGAQRDPLLTRNLGHIS